MGEVPEPADEIPGFVVELLDEQSPETLDATVEYLDGNGGIEPVPSAMVEAASMQDEATVEAIAEFSDELATFYRSTEHDSVLAAAEAAESEPPDDEEGGDGGTSALRHGGL